MYERMNESINELKKRTLLELTDHDLTMVDSKFNKLARNRRRKQQIIRTMKGKSDLFSATKILKKLRKFYCLNVLLPHEETIKRKNNKSIQINTNRFPS